jgi:hypothetical protein
MAYDPDDFGSVMNEANRIAAARKAERETPDFTDPTSYAVMRDPTPPNPAAPYLVAISCGTEWHTDNEVTAGDDVNRHMAQYHPSSEVARELRQIDREASE